MLIARIVVIHSMRRMPDLRIDWCSNSAALYAVKRWHYSRCLPVSGLYLGVWEERKFIGCVIFSRGASATLLMRYGLEQNEGCELTRIALGKHKTPVTRIMKIAIKELKNHCPGLRMIVSFADPRQGHHGGIYQAGNWIYAGESNCTRSWETPDGRVLHHKTVTSKGTRYDKSKLQQIIERGKHRYLYPLDKGMKSVAMSMKKEPPKRQQHRSDALGDQPGEGGATPTLPLQAPKHSK